MFHVKQKSKTIGPALLLVLLVSCTACSLTLTIQKNNSGSSINNSSHASADSSDISIQFPKLKSK